MVIAVWIGGIQTPCTSRSYARQARTRPLRASFLRVGLNKIKKRSSALAGGQDAASNILLVKLQAFALASDTAVVVGADLPSADLNDMCTLQLGMLYQLLSRAGTNYSSMTCTVYTRNFTSVGPGQVKLVRVAQFPVDAGQGEDFQTQQPLLPCELLLHTEQSWALQGGSVAVDPSAMIEECLLHREVVALPSSSSLVFPLVDCGVLVGLLVVGLDKDRLGGDAAASRSSGTGSTESEAVGAAGLGRACGAGVAALVTSPSLEQGSVHGQVQKRAHMRLTDEELQCLRLAVPLLAKACGMDARASWQLAQSSVTAATARGLLLEAQRPLSTLNTFGKMLVPRLKDGDPDKDMANGILVQGKRLQDLMWQLEDALHGPAVPGFAGLGAHVPPMPVAMPGVAGAPQALLQAPPFCSPSALPRDPSPAVQELLSLPQPRQVALPAAVSPQHQQPEAMTSSSSSMDTPVQGSLQYRSMDATVGPSDLEGASPRFTSRGPPGQVAFADQPVPTKSSSRVSTTTDAFTIRQPPAYLSSSSRTTSAAGLTSASVAGVRHGGRSGSLSSIASTATIDVEMDSCDTGSTSTKVGPAQPDQTRSSSRQPVTASTAPGAAWGWSPAQFNGAGGAHVAAATAVSTNLVSALAGVLTAAYRLAAVSGIGFIVNSPLSAVLPRRLGSAPAGGKTRPHLAEGNLPAGGSLTASSSSGAAGSQRTKVTAAAAVRDSDDAARLPAACEPRLIPRPARPLLVGVSAALLQKVVSYMLDIALQCTPRGGQVCVSARQDGGGVQLQVLHSGRMDLQRLHVRSRSMLHSPSGRGQVAATATMAAATTPSLGDVSVTHGSGAAAVAVAARPSVGTAPGSSSGGGSQVGSGVLSVELAQELAQQAGGHLTVSYPFNMVNAQSGSLDVGTSVEIWLPGPGALN